MDIAKSLFCYMIICNMNCEFANARALEGPFRWDLDEP